MEINNVMLTAYIYDTDTGDRVEFDKTGVAKALDNYDGDTEAHLRDKIPKNVRVECDRFNVISISSKSIIAREPSREKAKNAVGYVVHAMDKLDEQNDLSEQWDVEFNVSSVVASGEIDLNIDLYKSKELFDHYYHHVEYYSDIGYLKLDKTDTASIYLYESGKYTVKGATTVDEARNIGFNFEERIDNLSEDDLIPTIKNDVMSIKNSDSNITADMLDQMDPDDLNL
jgi:TATA-box binding protein (TBP) (component of TFIID and TFIIIB)